MAQILSGLVYLNTKPRSIIHYDLKPANILFDRNGECKITVRLGQPGPLRSQRRRAGWRACCSAGVGGQACGACMRAGWGGDGLARMLTAWVSWQGKLCPALAAVPAKLPASPPRTPPSASRPTPLPPSLLPASRRTLA